MSEGTDASLFLEVCVLRSRGGSGLGNKTCNRKKTLSKCAIDFLIVSPGGWYFSSCVVSVGGGVGGESDSDSDSDSDDVSVVSASESSDVVSSLDDMSNLNQLEL